MASRKPAGEEQRRSIVAAAPKLWTHAELMRANRLPVHAVEVFDRGDALGAAVRALRPFRAGDVVCSFGGRVFPTDERHSSVYALQLNRKWILDGDPRWPESRGHVGALVNDAAGAVRCNNGQNNVRFSVSRLGGRPAVLLRATRAINAGDELWVSYGRQYWR